MEAFSFPTAALNVLPISSRNISYGRSTLLFSAGSSSRCVLARKKRCTGLISRGLRRFGAPRAAGTNQNVSGSKEMPLEKEVVFVAGSTGRVGSRTVRELLKLGFQVRAGVRSVQRAEALTESVRKMNQNGASASTTEFSAAEKRLEIVECNLENQGEIRPAIGNASIVVCCIGAGEKEIFDVTSPYRIDYKATKNLIDAATSARVGHFILLTSLGTGKIGFPAALLNLFWGVLTWKRKAEEDLIASGLPYTIVRPGGMERPTDAFKETHNLTLATEDTYFGGLVSNLQVAELIAVMAKNRSLSFCKVVEVIAETTAPLTSMEELLLKIPSKCADIPKVKESTAMPVSDPTPLSISFESGQLKPLKARPLSPYTAYEDLKPPASPTPCAPGSKAFHSVSSDNGSPAAVAVSKVDPKPEKQKPLSPFTMYEDLKPPTSPTPRAPNPTKSNSNDINSTVTNTASENSLLLEQKSRPLSPYTMYEDLKPPSSPSPSKRMC